jgi:hypothetical protein
MMNKLRSLLTNEPVLTTYTKLKNLNLLSFTLEMDHQRPKSWCYAPCNEKQLDNFRCYRIYCAKLSQKPGKLWCSQLWTSTDYFLQVDKHFV